VISSNICLDRPLFLDSLSRWVRHVEPLLGLLHTVRWFPSWPSTGFATYHPGFNHDVAKCLALVLLSWSTLSAGFGH
jgi:hypothetical protein